MNDRKIPDKNDMANNFDTIFVDIDPNLASKIDYRNKRPFNEYLTKRILTSFHFDLMHCDLLKMITVLHKKVMALQ